MFGLLTDLFSGGDRHHGGSKKNSQNIIGLAQIEKMSNKELLDQLSRPVHTVDMKINGFKPTYNTSSHGMQGSPFVSQRFKR